MKIVVGDIGCDYAYLGSKTPAVVHAHGINHVVRYITRGGSSKALKPAERDMLLNAGIGIVLCWETSATAPFGGAPQGRLDGTEASKQATLLGCPFTVAILCAVDTDVVGSNSVLVNAYLRAFYGTCTHRRGLYGDEDAYELVADLDPVWCLPNALGWSPKLRRFFAAVVAKLTGRASQIHLRQGREDKTMGWDFPNRCLRPFDAWSLNTPEPVEEEMSQSDTIVTNKDQFLTSIPLEAKFLLLASGKLRHLDILEWQTRGSDPGVPWTNAAIVAAGVVAKAS